MKLNTLTKLGALAITLILTGCAETEVRELNHKHAKGSEFSMALANEYRQLANDEMLNEYDDFNAEHFAKKGERAAMGNGESVMPDELSSRELPKNLMNELTKARADLIRALDRHGRANHPIAAAKAQRAFDEWLEEAEERWESKETSMSRKTFYDNLKKMRCGHGCKHRFHHKGKES